MIQADFSRARVTHPNGIVSPGRFVFRNGIAAVWTEQRRPTKSAERVLYATGATYTRAPTARTPNLLQLEGGEQWSITPLSGGCGCNARNSPLAGITVEQLLSPDFTSVG